MPFLLREIIQRRYISIFYLHELKIDNARQVLGFLNSKYHFISLKEYIFSEDRKKLQGKSAIFTLDDGLVSNYDLLPLLKEMKIPCTIFVSTGIINTNRHFWWHDILNDENQIKYYKQLRNSERKLELFNNLGFDENRVYMDRQALNKNEIEEMSSVVDFQSHAIYHPIITKCDDDEAYREIVCSKSFLEKEFGFFIYAFSFPNGSFGIREINLVKNAGYKCALTTREGYNKLTSDRYTLKRISLCNILNIDELCIKSSGLYWIFKHIYYYLKSLFLLKDLY
jgi:poly-beta-1,6-N-acetyl-D-glucosamine N-deacetylase